MLGVWVLLTLRASLSGTLRKNVVNQCLEVGSYCMIHTIILHLGKIFKETVGNSWGI